MRPVEDKVFNEQRARQLHGKGRQRRQRPNQLFVVDVVEQKVRQGVCVACGARRGRALTDGRVCRQCRTPCTQTHSLTALRPLCKLAVSLCCSVGVSRLSVCVSVCVSCACFSFCCTSISAFPLSFSVCLSLCLVSLPASVCCLPSLSSLHADGRRRVSVASCHSVPEVVSRRSVAAAIGSPLRFACRDASSGRLLPAPSLFRHAPVLLSHSQPT